METNHLSEINKHKLHRLIFFTDALLAIIITLLVIELHLPNLINSNSASEMADKLVHMAPHFGAFILCFLTIGLAWIGVNVQYSVVIKYDNKLGVLNLLSLLPTCLLPFAASLIGNYFDNPMSFIFLAVISFCMAPAPFFIFRHLLKNKMLSPLVDQNNYKRMMKMSLAYPLFAILMGLTAFISTLLSFILFLLNIIITMVLIRKFKLTID